MQKVCSYGRISLSNYSLLPAAAAVSILDGGEFVRMERWVLVHVIREDYIFEVRTVSSRPYCNH